MKRFQHILLGVLAVLLASAAFAQTAATITGKLTDASGRPAKGVHVAITSARQGVKSETVSDDNGSFAFAQVEPDDYVLLATGSEYSDYTTSIQVGAGQTRAVSVKLNSAEESTSITIDERGTTLDQSSARTGINVTARELSHVPLNGRTYAPLALTAPGASTTGDGALDKIRFNGQSASQNRYTYDGVDFSGVLNTAPGWASLSGTRFHLQNSVESLEEFRVDSALYPAESGFGTGGQFSAISRSGGSQWHGDAFEYFRNDGLLSARNYFAGKNPSELRMNQFGASGGGALLKDKLFFTGSFEGLRQATGLEISEQVPDAAVRSAAPSAIQTALTTLPLPPSGSASVTRTGLAVLNESTWIGRLDYLPASAHRVFLRYFREGGDLSTPDMSVTSRSVTAATRPENLVVAWTGPIGSAVVNDLRFGFNRVPSNAASVASAMPGVLLDFKGSSSLTGIGGGPAVPGGLSRQLGDSFTSLLDVRAKSYSFVDNASWMWRTHSFKAGVEARMVRVPYRTLGSTLYMYDNIEQLLGSAPLYATYTPDLSFRVGEREYYGGYFLDQVHLRSNLTLNLGLRYDYYTPNRERDGLASVFDVSTFTYLDPAKGFPKAEAKAFQPRAALSWAPERFKGKTVVRLGGGLYNGPGQYADVMAPILNAAARVTYDSNATYPLNPASSGLPSPIGFDFPNYRASERNIQYGVSVQQQLPFHMVGQLGYTGSLSRNLYQRNLTNIGLGMSHPHPAFGEIEYITGGGRSYYNGMQLALTRQFVQGLTLGTNYTWSHSIGDALGSSEADLPQDYTCLACERSDVSSDVRHVVSATAVYDLSFGSWSRGRGWRAAMLRSWSVGGALNIRTGLPVTAYSRVATSGNTVGMPADGSGGASPDGAPGVGFSVALAGKFRPNYVAGVDPYLKNGTQWLNPAAFTTVGIGESGTLGRNALRGPGFWQADLMLSRGFVIRERARIEFRMEAFNIFNHTNFGQPYATVAGDTSSSSSAAIGFGSLNSTAGQNIGLGTSRQVQAGLRISF